MNGVKTPRGPLLDHLDEIEAKCLEGDPTLEQIFKIFGSDGHFVLIAFLIIPFLQPIPLPGLSTPFGALMAVIAGLAYLGKPPWIPKRWAHRKVSAKIVLRIAELSEHAFAKLTPIFRVRGERLFREPFRGLSAFLLILNAILLALPLPIPFSNFLPAWAIGFQVLAQLEDDGLFVGFAYLQSFITAIYFFALARGAWFGVDNLFL